MDLLNELKELYELVQAIPPQVFLNALYLWLGISFAKYIGLVQKDGYAALANVFLSIIANGGFENLSDLNSALVMWPTAVLAAVYYQVWKWLYPKLKELYDKRKK
jgi:hypothetical protein